MYKRNSLFEELIFMAFFQQQNAGRKHTSHVKFNNISIEKKKQRKEKKRKEKKRKRKIKKLIIIKIPFHVCGSRHGESCRQPAFLHSIFLITSFGRFSFHPD